MSILVNMGPVCGLVALCVALRLSRATYYRQRNAAQHQATASAGASVLPVDGPGVTVAVQVGPEPAFATSNTCAAVLEPPAASEVGEAGALELIEPVAIPPEPILAPWAAAALSMGGPGVALVAPATSEPSCPTPETSLVILEAPGAPEGLASRSGLSQEVLVSQPTSTSTQVGHATVVGTVLASSGQLEASVVVKPPKLVPRALSHIEELHVLELLNSARFCDLSPAETYATLLDEGLYLCSERTMYRILAAHAEVKERRNLLRHPVYAAPELMATKPNDVWTWDITKLRGPGKGDYFHLYVILDLYSRYVVGWMVSASESGEQAEQFIDDTCARHGITRGQLTVHADRGTSMRSKTVALLLADLGVIKSHSRPSVSDDNPYSEAQFKTLKYRPDFPDRFGSLEDARAHCKRFFAWYNTEHYARVVVMRSARSGASANASTRAMNCA